MRDESAPATPSENKLSESVEPSLPRAQDEPSFSLPAEEPEETKEKGALKSSKWKMLREAAETILLAVVLFMGINLVTARVRVDGFSMVPTLHDGEIILVNRLAYWLGEPQRGEIIVFHFPGDPSQEYIKRIIGLPGDSVFIQNGQVILNGQILSEPYIQELPGYNFQIEVPAESLFVLGDNRNNSSDSHTWGVLPKQAVVGKAVFIYWPINAWRWVPHATVTP